MSDDKDDTTENALDLSKLDDDKFDELNKQFLTEAGLRGKLTGFESVQWGTLSDEEFAQKKVEVFQHVALHAREKSTLRNAALVKAEQEVRKLRAASG